MLDKDGAGTSLILYSPITSYNIMDNLAFETGYQGPVEKYNQIEC